MKSDKLFLIAHREVAIRREGKIVHIFGDLFPFFSNIFYHSPAKSKQKKTSFFFLFNFFEANSRPVVLPPAFQPFQFIERMEGELVKTSEEACIIS